MTKCTCSYIKIGTKTSNTKNLNPDCPRKDCKFTILDSMRTCMYFQPIYDENGVNINPDANTTSFKLNCLSCGKMWYGKSRLDETTYKEVDNEIPI